MFQCSLVHKIFYLFTAFGVENPDVVEAHNPVGTCCTCHIACENIRPFSLPARVAFRVKDAIEILTI